MLLGLLRSTILRTMVGTRLHTTGLLMSRGSAMRGVVQVLYLPLIVLGIVVPSLFVIRVGVVTLSLRLRNVLLSI